ncbi:MAG TPA: alpha-amylase [Firmicutes bacterium]|nr:alpha-amylase [Bacillota bacterium]
MHNKLLLKNETMYQIYVRNHTREGTFRALEGDLPRLKDLGVSILYLLPINPIGEESRKGTLGSPYSIKDYFAINPELGTHADFLHFLKVAHTSGFKVMIDVVLNHTSRDATLVKEHPEFYYYKDGKLANRIGEWSDIADLRLDLTEVRNYLIKMMEYWVDQGVDGFRCDVAPLIPLDFWKQVITACNNKNPNLIWLSESIEPDFIKYLRQLGYHGYSDSEMFQVFDVLYDYDVYPFLKTYLVKDGDLKAYLRQVRTQEYIYPADYLKIHFLENHDQMRIAAMVNNDVILRNLTAWSFFQNGIGFIYAGQETKNTKTPSLFDKQPIDLSITDKPFYDLIKKLIAIKKNPCFSKVRRFDIIEHLQLDLIVSKMTSDSGECFGIFNTSKHERQVYVPMEDGQYLDLISDKTITVDHGIITIKEPLFLKEI